MTLQTLPTQRLGVVGWPVLHSRSPLMHNAALAAVGLVPAWHYQHLPVPPELFAETVKALPEQDFVGVNVTIPHKQAALAVADDSSKAAQEIGAANTLTFTDGQIRADNTDATGLINCLPLSPKGKTATVLGAGGSARAVIWALINARAAEVTLWNRSQQRAEQLAEEFELELLTSSGVAGCDLLINCTAVGLTPNTDPFSDLPLVQSQLDSFGCIVDLVYGSGPTQLVTAAQAAGTVTVDGLEFLAAQGAESFTLWTKTAAPLAVMRQALNR